ncbi:MAG: Mov34/MPN/PAD-1 family protein [Terriglobales bacterium]
MLRIGKSELDELRRHGEETYPCESCGVLLGEVSGDGNKVVKTVVRCNNARLDSPHNRYHIDPRELLRIQREARDRQQDILGFYHSHPDHPAHWSSTDLDEAHWIGSSYVITSVHQGRAQDTNSFQLAGDEDTKHFEDEPITVFGDLVK